MVPGRLGRREEKRDAWMAAWKGSKEGKAMAVSDERREREREKMPDWRSGLLYCSLRHFDRCLPSQSDFQPGVVAHPALFVMLVILFS